MKYINRIALMAIVVTIVIVNTACAPEKTETPTAVEITTLTVWHAWDDNEIPFLERFVASYETNHQDVDLNLVAFDSKAILKEKLLTAGEDGPDIFFGPHTWSNDLLNKGITSAYCLPDQCEQCSGDNPPDWCSYAKGNFDHFAIESLRLTTAYCLPGMCEICNSRFPPPWCKFAAVEEFEFPIDILQASMSAVFDDEILPVGIPLMWECPVVLVNSTLFEEAKLELPTTLAELGEIAQDQEGVYYDTTFFERNSFTIPDPLLQANDPTPEPSAAAALVINAADFNRLQNRVGLCTECPEECLEPNPPPYCWLISQDKIDFIDEFTPLLLEDYQIEFVVQGAYFHSQSVNRVSALDFMYELAGAEAQSSLLEVTGNLPANNEVWNSDLATDTNVNILLEYFGQHELVSGGVVVDW